MSTQTIETGSRTRDEFIALEVARFVRGFQTLKIRLTPETDEASGCTFVHPPYMLQSVTLIDNEARFNRLKERHRARLLRVKAARETACEAVRRFLDEQFYEGGREKYLASGRAEPAEIRELLQQAVDRGLVSGSGGKQYPDGYDLRVWLKKYGVGVDCSGFVQQALKRLVVVSQLAVSEGPNSGSKLDKLFLRCRRVYDEVTGGATCAEPLFGELFTPAETRPGDILVSRRHMRIVISTEVAEEGIVFEVAESTSARDVPTGQTSEEDDIGPRIIQVKYPKPDQPISRQRPLKKRLVDNMYREDSSEKAYVIGRYREIEQL